MRGLVRLTMVAALLASVAACSSGSNAPGAVSADEQAQLNDAAAMLDANSIDANSLDDADATASSNESTTQ